MTVTQARLNRYRSDIDAYGDAAASYVEQYIAALIAENPGIPVAELREEAIEAVDDALNAFGDQASTLALDLFDEIVEQYGMDAESSIIDVIPREMIDGGVRYSAKSLVEGKSDKFTRDVADLTRYYIHRSAFENMERNCERNDLRYARVPSGRETCGFCFMLSSRGFVYRSEQTAGSTHAYHDHCDCVIVPGFKDDDRELGPQIEGYDPDEMRERWRMCQETIGGENALKARWKAMNAKARSRYKGDNDQERYRRFVNAQTIREAETRDFRWLNTGETPHYEIEAGARPSTDEIRTAKRLAEHGFKSRFRKTRGEDEIKTSDVFFLSASGESEWDFKNPEGNGSQTVFHQFEDAAGQTKSVVIDFSKSGDKYADNDYAVSMIRKFIRYHYTVESGVNKGSVWQFDETIAVLKDGSIKRVMR